MNARRIDTPRLAGLLPALAWLLPLVVALAAAAMVHLPLLVEPAPERN